MDVRVLLFSSMLKPTERYLFKEIKDKVSIKGKIKNLKTIVSKTVNKKTALARKKTAKGCLDSQIETAIQDVKNPEQTEINESLVKEVPRLKFIKYKSQVNEIRTGKKFAIKNPYKFFAGYVKSTYRSIKKFKKIPDLEPEQVGYEFDAYSKRFRIIRAPKINGKSYLTI